MQDFRTSLRLPHIFAEFDYGVFWCSKWAGAAVAADG